MPEDISQPTAKEIYYAIEQYFPSLPEALQAPVQTMLARARAGEKMDNALIALIAEDAKARTWLRQALFGGETARLMGEYAPLSGLPVSVPANSLWICPQCGFEWRVSRAGRPVPPCPRDGSALTPAEKQSKAGR